jgi:hypothetical protein
MQSLARLPHSQILFETDSPDQPFVETLNLAFVAWLREALSLGRVAGMEAGRSAGNGKETDADTQDAVLPDFPCPRHEVPEDSNPSAARAPSSGCCAPGGVGAAHSIPGAGVGVGVGDGDGDGASGRASDAAETRRTNRPGYLPFLVATAALWRVAHASVPEGAPLRGSGGKSSRSAASSAPLPPSPLVPGKLGFLAHAPGATPFEHLPALIWREYTALAAASSNNLRALFRRR